MYAGNPAAASNALKLAQQEIAARQDVWTLDAYAWALYANEKFQDADAVVQNALAVGIKSAQIFDHAGHIAQKLNRSADAAKYFQLSVQSNPASEYAADALKSASLAAVADDHEQKVSQIVPAPALLQAPVAHGFLSVSDQSNHNAASVGVGMTNAATVFAPVSEALLTPHPTGTDHLIRSAQATVARSPIDATAYERIGRCLFPASPGDG